MDDRSILLRLEEAGRPAPRLELKGPAPASSAEALRAKAEAPPGKDRYELIGEIARGGVGVVHRARDTDLGRDVALKVLRDEHVANPEIVQRFVEEAQIGGQLQHPGIVPVLELGVREGRQPFFAMKLVKGETLSAALAARPDVAADRRRLLGVYAQACQTVAYAHARGVIHRDLKPSNIMIGAFGEVQVVDWGFAKVLRKGGVDDERRARRDTTMIATVRSGGEGSASVAGSVMGTPAYMPPEQALGHIEHLDARADVFALGAILCEILTGKPPYTGTGQEQLLAASQCRLEDALARLDRCAADAELVALSKRAMSPLPNDRLGSARELAEALTSHLVAAERRAHEARLLAAKQRAELERQQRIRRLTLVVAAGVLGLVVLGGSAFQWMAQEGAQRERRRAAAVEAALQEAERSGAAGDFVAALAAAERARDLGGGAEAETRAAELRRAKDAADAAANRRAEDEAFLAELEEIRARFVDDRDFRRMDADWVATFTRRRFDLSDTGPIVRRFRGSHLASGLAAALHAFADMRRVQIGYGWQSIHALAREIDAAPQHEVVRAAEECEDGATLRALLEGTAIEELPCAAIPFIAQRLHDLRQREASIAFLRRARDLHPDDFWIQLTLGCSLPFTDAETSRAFAAAVALRPRSVGARTNLGIALTMLGDHEGAVACHRETLRLDPGCIWAHNALGSALTEKGDVDGAIAAYREVIRLRPRFAMAHYQLGCLLAGKGDGDGAVAAYREAIQAFPDYAEAHCNIGSELARRGRFEEALPWLRKGHELGSRRSDWNYPSADWIARCARHAELAKRLPDVLSGKASPHDAKERVGLAEICCHRGLYSDAARLYVDALAGDPPAVPEARYNAACAAVLAAGEADGPAWRGRALGWLRADLAAPGSVAAATTARRLDHWRKDPDLASIRDRIDDLPEAERADWKKLWADVDAVLARTRGVK